MNDLVMNRTGYVPVIQQGTASISPQPLEFSGVHVSPIDGLPIFMQAKQPSCVGHTVAWSKMQYDLAHTGSFKLLSPRFVYAMSKKTDGIQGPGTSISNALKVAEQYGICEDQYFPNDVSLSEEEYADWTKIPQAAFDNALQHKLTSQTLTDRSFNGLANGVKQYGLVLIGMDICDSWWTDASGNITWAADAIDPLRPPKSLDPSLSRHAISLYAANTNLNLLALMNWWSDQWSSKGTAFFYPNDLSYIYEAHVITG